MGASKSERSGFAWLAVLLAWAGPAAAQDPPAPCAGGVGAACVPNPSVPVPANGAITVAAVPGQQVMVKVFDEIGTELPGSLMLLADGMWAWQPTQPPAPGNYYVQVRDNLGNGNGEKVEFIAAAERAWPELISAASLSQVIANEAPACCTLDTGNGIIDFACSTLAETTYAVLHPGLSSASSPVELNQYLFRYTTPSHSGKVAVLPWSTAPELRMYEMSDEYCYEVAAIDLVTGIIHPYTELSARCAPHGGLAPIDSTPKQLADEALLSPICPMPPEGFATRWCELNAATCEVDEPPRHCHFYPFTCLNQPYPGAGWRGLPLGPRGALDVLIGRVEELNDRTTDETNDGGHDDAGTTQDAGAADAAAERPDDSHPGGCTILRQHTQASLSHLIFALTAGCAWQWRRRRNR